MTQTPETPPTGRSARVGTGSVSAMSDPRNEIFFTAIETTRMPMVVSDPHRPDNPIVFANDAFLDMTATRARR